MARVTVEDCLEKLDNHFKLVLVANHRARQLLGGKEPLVKREGDKVTVLALREIATGMVNEEILEEPVEQKDIAEEELKGLLAETLAEPELSDQEIFGDLDEEVVSESDREAVQDKLAEQTEAAAVSAEAAANSQSPTDKIDSDTLQSVEPQAEEQQEEQVLQADDYNALLAETGAGDAIDLDTLQSVEQQVEAQQEEKVLQVDDHDTMLAETAEEIEQRADLDLDQIEVEEDTAIDEVSEENEVSEKNDKEQS